LEKNQKKSPPQTAVIRIALIKANRSGAWAIKDHIAGITIVRERNNSSIPIR
jgi:hypothetical protein